ncbi:MAG: transcription antitermination factor NusB [Actinobacteria bacterium]|nr:transcription antitermination factor NusB [Actinomycetota bacterium]
MHLLYEAEIKDQPVADVIAALPVPPDGYAVAVATGADQQRAGIDATLGRFARGWDVERMPALDRAVLRLATYELGHRPDVPRNVVINEAVELAKRYSTDGSGAFVNGMLARIADELRGPDGP